jgi:hypothetical protein
VAPDSRAATDTGARPDVTARVKAARCEPMQHGLTAAWPIIEVPAMGRHRRWRLRAAYSRT